MKRRSRSNSPAEGAAAKSAAAPASKAATTAAAMSADAKKQALATCQLPLKLFSPADSSAARGWFMNGHLLASHTGMHFEPTLASLPAPTNSALVAAFDFDGCIATTSFSQPGPSAWKIRFPATCSSLLAALCKSGYRIVVMSNQADIGRAASAETRQRKLIEKTGRFAGAAKAIGVPMLILAATAKTDADDIFRKPSTGMFDFLEKHLNGGIAIDRVRSFYVGDAAGRPKGPGRPAADHSDSDLVFARNAKVPFFTETDFFVDKKHEALVNGGKK